MVFLVVMLLLYLGVLVWIAVAVTSVARGVDVISQQIERHHRDLVRALYRTDRCGK